MIKKLLVVISIALVSISCDKNISSHYADTCWIDKQIAIDSNIYKDGYLIESEFYYYTTTCSFNENGEFYMVEGTLSKKLGSDSLLVSLMEGGIIYEGSWEPFENAIVVKYSAVESKLLLSEKELKKLFEIEYLDTIAIDEMELKFDDSLVFIPIENESLKYYLGCSNN